MTSYKIPEVQAQEKEFPGSVDLINQAYNYTITHSDIETNELIGRLMDELVHTQMDLGVARAKLEGTWPEYEKHTKGYLTFTSNSDGDLVMVAKQDSEHKILKIYWMK